MITPRHHLMFAFPRRGRSTGVWPPQRQPEERVQLLRYHHIWSGAPVRLECPEAVEIPDEPA